MKKTHTILWDTAEHLKTEEDIVIQSVTCDFECLSGCRHLVCPSVACRHCGNQYPRVADEPLKCESCLTGQPSGRGQRRCADARR